MNIADKDWDGRILRENKVWAKDFLAEYTEDFMRRKGECYLTTHPGLLNLFVDNVREQMEKSREVMPEKDEIYDYFDLKNNAVTFSVVSIDGGDRFVVPEYLDRYDVHALEQYQEYISEYADVPLEHQKNFVITDENLGVKTPKARFAANIEAIRTLNAIEAEHRTATPEEQTVLSGYTGWGAIPQAFDPDNKEWSGEYAQLKGLLTDEEYSAARRSTMNAHFTSPVVINAIYEGLKNIGFEKGKILEPAMGIGNFFGAMPEAMRVSEYFFIL